MANEKLSWIFDLIDRMSGPATKIQTSLAGMNVQINITNRGVIKLGAETEKAGKSLLSMGADLAGWLSIVRGIGGTLGGWGAAGASWVVDTLSFKESMMASFRILEGSEAAAKRMFNTAVDFANVTPFNTREVVDAFKALRGAGIASDEVENVFAGLADAGAMSGNSGAIKSIIYQLAQAKGKGKLQGQDWRTMQEHLGPAGLGQEEVFANIAKNMQIAPAEVMRAMEAGQITWRQGLFAILETAEQKFGKLGAVAVAQGNTIAGLLEQLRSRPDEWLFMDSSELNADEGINIFKTALVNLNSVLATTSESGKRIQKVLFDMVNRTSKGLFGDLAGENGLANAEAGVKRVLKTVESIFNFVAGLGDLFRGMGEAIAPQLMKTFDSLDPADPKAFGTAMRAAGLEIGGVIAQVMALVRSIAELLASLGFGPKKKVDEHARAMRAAESPLMAEFERSGLVGLLTLAGTGVAPSETGVEGMGSFGAAWGSSLGSGWGPNVAPDRGSWRAGGPTANDRAMAAALGEGSVQINIDNRGHEDADAIARKIKPAVHQAMSEALMSMATEGGN